MNVVLVVVDTLRRDAISPYNPEQETPNLDRIADRSVVFEDVTASSCWTMPTHASMFTGQYPSRHGAIEPRLELGRDIPLVSELLSAAGYRTHAVNIPHPLSGDAGFNRGWDEYGNTYADPKPVQAWRLLRSWVDLGLAKEPLAALKPSYLAPLRSNYRTRVAIDHVLDVARADGDEPFFAFTNLFAAHKDYRPFPRHAPDVSEDARRLAERIRGETDGHHYQLRLNYGDLELDQSVIDETRELYQAEVRWIDESLGRLFDGLDDAGRLDDTVVMITGDHGELFGESERIPVAHRNSLHPVLLDVPFLLYHPDLDPARDDRLASHCDVAPTILEAAGVEDADVLEAMDGYSLLGDDRHETVFAEHGPSELRTADNLVALQEKYDLDFSPYHETAKVARTKEFTVRVRDGGAVRAHDRRNPDAEVPDDVVQRLRDAIDARLGWTSRETTGVSEDVRSRLKDVGYLG